MNATAGDKGRLKFALQRKRGGGKERERDLERTEDHERGDRAGTRDRKKGYNMVDWEVEIAENVEVKLAKKWR